MESKMIEWQRQRVLNFFKQKLPSFAEVVEKVFATDGLRSCYPIQSHLQLCLFDNVKSVTQVPRAELRFYEEIPRRIEVELVYFYEIDSFSHRTTVGFAELGHILPKFTDEFLKLATLKGPVEIAQVENRGI